MTQMPIPQDELVAAEPAIAARGLVRRFGKVQALCGLDFTIPPGHVTALVGNNGAGKTTAIHVLMGFLPPNGGGATVLGLDPGRQAREIHKRVGFFPERDEPYGWIRLETLFAMGAAAYPSWDRELCAALCRRFELDPKRRVKQLSKGMVAKTKLIFALAHRPECLLLDEPTGGLDPGSRHDLRMMVQEQSRQRGVTTLFSTHNLDDVPEVATDVIVIHQGRTLLAADVQAIRNRFVLAELVNGPAEAPPSVAELVLRSAVRPPAAIWLIKDRNSPAWAAFKNERGRGRVIEHRLSLPALFHFLTTGWIESAPGEEEPS